MWSAGHLPESSSFLHVMARADRKRVLEAGWPFRKTLFVESDLLCWTAVNSGIARDFERGSRWRRVNLTGDSFSVTEVTLTQTLDAQGSRWSRR